VISHPFEMEIKDTLKSGYETVDLIRLAEDRIQCEHINEPSVFTKAENFLNN
jgi:hypothetical protein